MPAENMVNTNELRFVERAQKLRPGTSNSDVNVIYKLRILQQRWVLIGTMRGELDATNSEWRDVPLVAEGSATIGEVERLRSILRKCMPGTSIIEIAPGEVIGLYQQSEAADASR